MNSCKPEPVKRVLTTALGVPRLPDLREAERGFCPSSEQMESTDAHQTQKATGIKRVVVMGII